MQTDTVSFHAWQQRFATDAACAQELAERRWPEGFRCPHCAHDRGWYTATRQLYECARCHRQTSPTAGTVFHGSRVPLHKWFWALYWVGSDKGSISALRLSKLIGVSWRSAYTLLRKLRIAMGHRDTLYRLAELVEVDDAYLGGKRPGKPGRAPAEGKTPILVACETREGRPGFVAIETISAVTKEQIVDFARRRLDPAAIARSDAFSSMTGLGVQVTHIPRITPPEQVDGWLPWVHIVISNLKRFLIGTYHGAVRPHRLQEYIDEFCYRFNRRFWEPQIPNRLLGLCANHLPVDLRGT